MDIVVEYGRNIPEVAERVKEVIHREVANMTQLDVIEVNINVVDIKSEAEYQEDSETVQDKVSNAASKTGDFCFSTNRKS